jgi:hypothetical protein
MTRQRILTVFITATGLLVIGPAAVGQNLRVDGNIGVGTSATDKLHIMGLNDTESKIFFQKGADTSAPGIPSIKLVIDGPISLLGGGVHYIDGLRGLNSNGAPVHIAGTLGVGVTPPGAELHVKSLSGNGDVRITSNNGKGDWSVASGTGGAISLWDNTAQINRFIIDSMGNVTMPISLAVGTTPAKTALQVTGKIAPSRGSTVDPTYRFGTGGEASGLSSPYANTVSVITNGSERLRVRSGTTTTGGEVVALSDLFVSSSSRGVILKAPGGNCFRVTVNDAGSLATTGVNCPAI